MRHRKKEKYMKLPELRVTRNCGPIALYTVCRMKQKDTDYNTILELAGPDENGVSLLTLKNAAEKLGLRALLLRTNIDGLRSLETPVIVHLRRNHFDVITNCGRRTVTLSGRVLWKKIPFWLFRLEWSGAVLAISNK